MGIAPPEPQRSLLLLSLIAHVRPHGAVWCEGGLPRIRYANQGEPVVIGWREVAVLIGKEPRDMTQKIRERLERAKSRPVQPPRRKPIRTERHFDVGEGRTLTPELIAEANREARDWHERSGGHTSGVGAFELANGWERRQA